MSRRARNRIKPGHLWGALCNAEPTEEDDGMDALAADGFDLGPDECAAELASDRHHQQDRDARVSQ